MLRRDWFGAHVTFKRRQTLPPANPCWAHRWLGSIFIPEG